MASQNPKLDLILVDTHNLKVMGIIDTSFYPINWSIDQPQIEITPPGFDRIVVPFSPKALTMYNSSNLGVTCIDGGLVELPDGIWEIKYSINPSSTLFVEKSFLRVEQIKSKLEKLFLHTDMVECDGDVKERDMKEIDQIEFFINGAISSANDCNSQLALKLYNLANKMVDNQLKNQ